MIFFFYSALALAAVIFGLFWLVSTDHEYRDLGFPWYKRPLAFWGFIVAALIFAIISN